MPRPPDLSYDTDREERASLFDLMASATQSAAAALSQMAGRGITAGPTRIRVMPLQGLSYVAGDPERPAFAVYVSVRGHNRGHILLALSDVTAHTLASMLLDGLEAPSAVLGPLAISALAEAGNVTASFFLTALADPAHLVLPPSPPVVLHEMRGAIFDSLASALALDEQDDALVIETEFVCQGQVAEITFYVFPAPSMIQAVTRGILQEANDAERHHS